MYNDEERYDIFELDDKVYIPTPVQATLLKALCECPAGTRRVEDICRVAKISLDSYYRSMRDPNFRKAYYSVLMDSLTVKAGKVIDSVFKYGTENAKCHSDRKMMLEMLGLYEKKQKVDINKKEMNVSINMKKTTTEELKQLMKELVKSDPKLLEELTSD